MMWQKSSYSANPENNCIELASAAPSAPILLRESEVPDVILAATPDRLDALLRSVKAGQLRPVA